MSRNINIKDCVISGFADGNQDNFFFGIKGYFGFDNNTDLSMVLSNKKITLDYTFLKWQGVPKKILVTPEEGVQTLWLSPSQGLENLLPKLKGFPYHKYTAVCSFIAIAQQNNHLLIIVAFVCFVTRIALKANLNYADLNMKDKYSNKNFGKFCYQYILPGYLINKKLIKNILKTQLKNTNNLDIYQIKSDLNYYRNRFDQKLQYINRIIYFYFFIPLVSLVEKMILSYVWCLICDFLSIFTNSIQLPLGIQNIYKTQAVINMGFMFNIMLVACINYLPVLAVNKYTTTIDTKVYNKCVQFCNNRKNSTISDSNKINTPFA